MAPRPMTATSKERFTGSSKRGACPRGRESEAGSLGGWARARQPPYIRRRPRRVGALSRGLRPCEGPRAAASEPVRAEAPWLEPAERECPRDDVPVRREPLERGSRVLASRDRAACSAAWL